LYHIATRRNELEAACLDWCEQVNARPHRAIGVSPTDRLVEELPKLHVLPDNPHIPRSARNGW
jgi:hypothetical protein